MVIYLLYLLRISEVVYFEDEVLRLSSRSGETEDGSENNDGFRNQGR